MTVSNIRTRVGHLIEQLCQGLYEREEPVKLALLSAVAGESIFLLGPPGVGKSLIARRLKFAFRDGTSFEYLMSKFSTPDEIFGPVSIRKLKEEDRYERLTERYLPGANIVFLDEIWKSGSAIQNALLTILNEKVYRNGEQEVRVDIKGIITASNELPPDGEGFLPLWDRFLIRYEMGNVREQRNFLNMITDTADVYADDLDEAVKFSQVELEQWHEAINEVIVPPEVLNTVQVIRAKITAYNEKPNRETEAIRIYDRRWKKLVRLLRTSAFLHGREAVNLMDCFLAVHCLWSHPSQRPILQEIVGESVRQHGYTMAVNLNMLRKEIDTFEGEVDQEIRIRHEVAEDRLELFADKYYAFAAKEKPFQGDYVRAEDYKKLQREEFIVINIYDTGETLRHRLQVRRSGVPHNLEVFVNSAEYTLPLRTHQVSRTEVIYKAPHPMLATHWDGRCEKLRGYIAEQLQRLKDDAPAPLKDVEQHLFVDARLAELVRANLDAVRETLSQLDLRLEKLQYAYASQAAG